MANLQKWQNVSWFKGGNDMVYARRKNQIQYNGFQYLTKEDKSLFQPFLKDAEFGDWTFSMLYAWQDTFQYAYKQYDDALVILEHSLDQRLSVLILRNNNTDITSIVSELYDVFQELQMRLRFVYISENELEMYQKAAVVLGKRMQVSYSIDDSDYIYQTYDFLDIEGKANKGKRGGLNSLYKEYPDIHMVCHSEQYDATQSCLEIFDSWCCKRDCTSCYYGCEKKAFKRFMEVFDSKQNRLCVAYANNNALSFAVSEDVGKDTVCYFFQKNAKRIRGLTYWLNHQMALKHPDKKYINLGEDMGIDGLREDKSGLHPCHKKTKYYVEIG